MGIEIWLIILGALLVLAVGAMVWILVLRQRDRETIATLRATEQASTDKLDWINQARDTLNTQFKALASDALRANSADLTDQAKKEVKGAVDPLTEKLKELDQHVRALESKREGAYKGITGELDRLATMHKELTSTTNTLSNALRNPVQRGKWGEFELRHIVEMAGMTDHVSFDEQMGGAEGRPDMIVHLPNAGELPIDSKVPLDSYLNAMEAKDLDKRAVLLQGHARALKDHIKALGSRAYWSNFDRAPDFVVMFVPNESCLGAAFEADRDLLEFALQNKVLITSPVNLLALLKTVAYGWQQHQAADQALKIFDAGRELHERIKVFATHLGKVAKGLDGATKGYNEAVRSYQTRIVPAARRFEGLAPNTKELPELPEANQQPALPEEPRSDEAES